MSPFYQCWAISRGPPVLLRCCCLYVVYIQRIYQSFAVLGTARHDFNGRTSRLDVHLYSLTVSVNPAPVNSRRSSVLRYGGGGGRLKDSIFGGFANEIARMKNLPIPPAWSDCADASSVPCRCIPRAGQNCHSRRTSDCGKGWWDRLIKRGGLI